MKKIFNIAGPCLPEEHYMLPARERCADVMPLIEYKQYFVIHAARQTGKTTLLLDLVRELNASGQYHALYCSLETAQGIDDVEKGIKVIVNKLWSVITFNPDLKHVTFDRDIEGADGHILLNVALSRFCHALDKPLVILFDEVDCLVNGTLISFLRQLRDGYVSRATVPFAHCIALVGMRNIRDYKGRIREERQTLGSASPFNIMTKSLTLRNFTCTEIEKLYDQHTQATAQPFSQAVIERVFYFTQGQPWLVNAVVREILYEILGRDFSRQIKPEYVDQAVENIILRRDTHIDSLLERLKEERVRKVIEPVITGQAEQLNQLDDDFQYVWDLGLLRKGDKGLEPANPIYGEVIIRRLNYNAQEHLSLNEFYPYNLPEYLSADGSIDMRRLLVEFQHFWRENSEIWQERFEYREAAPHLILMAFLQRVLNGGGRIDREYSSGRGRIDLCLHHGGRRYPVELKIRYGENVYVQGREQILRYMERLDCEQGWLVVFDRRKDIPWTEKIFWKTEDVSGKSVYIVGC